jgi:hypothetical protein
MTNMQPPSRKERRRNFYSRIDEAVSYRPLSPATERHAVHALKAPV